MHYLCLRQTSSLFEQSPVVSMLNFFKIIDTDDNKDSGFTTIQIDTQQPLSPRKCWWNAFTAEDVDRLLDIGSPVQCNPYTAEDMDQLWQLGPAKRRSLGRGSYGRRYLCQ